VYFWSALDINYAVGDHLLNIPTKLVPIGVVVSEKKIKMKKFTDDDRRQVMVIHDHMTLWTQWAIYNIRGVSAGPDLDEDRP
jgi:hypothetical protein